MNTSLGGTVDGCMVSLALASSAMFLESLAAKCAIEFNAHHEHTPDWMQPEEDSTEREALRPVESVQLVSLSRRLAYTNSHFSSEDSESIREAGRLIGIVRKLMEQQYTDGAHQIAHKEIWAENIALLKRVESACGANKIQDCVHAQREKANEDAKRSVAQFGFQMKLLVAFLILTIGLNAWATILKLLWQ